MSYRKYILASVISLLSLAPCLGKAQEAAQVINDDDLLRYQASSFNAGQVMNKTIVIGMHNGVPVVAEHPCSDLCPRYTTRIIHYAIPNEKCDIARGKLVRRSRPVGIATGSSEYCVPEVLAKKTPLPVRP